MLDTVVRSVFAGAVLLTLALPTLGQSVDDPTARALSLAEALNRTLSDNASLRARGFDVSAAEGALLQSTFRPNPRLNIVVEDALGTDTLRGIRGTETKVSLGWILERNIRERIVDAARARVGVRSNEVEITQLDVLAETARRYIDCLFFQESFRNAEIGVELARDAVTAVRARVDASRAPNSELARAEAELARAELKLEDFEHERLSAYHRLSAQWGVTRPDFAFVTGVFAAIPEVDSFEALLTRVGQNPDLAAYVSQSRLAQAELALARARSRPSWEISGGLERLEATDDWAIIGGVSIPLRLGNRNQGRIAETQATVDQVDADAAAERVRIETELFVLYQELIHNIELAASLEDNVRPKLETALSDTRRAFDVGRSSYLDLRAVQTELLDVAYEILDAHANAYRLAIELERLTGETLSTQPISE